MTVEWLWNIVLFIIGFFILIKGAHWLVEGDSSLAKALGGFRLIDWVDSGIVRNVFARADCFHCCCGKETPGFSIKQYSWF